MLWPWMDMDGVGVEVKYCRIFDIFGTWLDWQLHCIRGQRCINMFFCFTFPFANCQQRWKKRGGLQSYRAYSKMPRRTEEILQSGLEWQGHPPPPWVSSWDLRTRPYGWSGSSGELSKEDANVVICSVLPYSAIKKACFELWGLAASSSHNGCSFIFVHQRSSSQ